MFSNLGHKIFSEDFHKFLNIELLEFVKEKNHTQQKFTDFRLLYITNHILCVLD